MYDRPPITKPFDAAWQMVCLTIHFPGFKSLPLKWDPGPFTMPFFGAGLVQDLLVRQ